MKTITVKYDGVCRKCGAALVIGQQAAYERITGMFCHGCVPTDPEEIRAYRQERADAKAERYQGWADKRRKRAASVFKADSWADGNTAFNTQPGHIPGRAQMIARHDRQFESLRTAEKFEDKAASFRAPVAVKGDAAARDERARLKVLEWLRVGMVVDCGYCAPVTILKINKKTARVKSQFGESVRELIFISRI
jgi:hypothetical protein